MPLLANGVPAVNLRSVDEQLVSGGDPGADGSNVIAADFGERARPRVNLVVEVTDAAGNVISRDQYEVLRPPGPVRQHEQLVRMVTGQLPDARIVSASRGRVKLICQGHIVTSCYEDVLDPVPAEPEPA